MARLPDPYRYLEPELAAWSRWSRSYQPQGRNLIARCMAEAKAGASHKQDGPRAPIGTPASVDRIERAVCQLPDTRWRLILIGEWHLRLRRIDLAKRLHVCRDTLWGMRRHAYGALHDALATPAGTPTGRVG